MVKVVVRLLLAGLIFGAAPAQAHKIIASVFPSGANVEGEIGFSNGDMAANTLVEVFDHQGNKLDEVRTDKDGFFVYQPSRKVDLVFRADLGAGHIAEVRFDISELSDLDAPAGDGTVVSNAGVQTPQQDALVAGDGVPLEAQKELIASVVRDELRPLRREISAYKEKNDLQSILGGIGYIFGFFGIAYYIAARRLKDKATKP